MVPSLFLASDQHALICAPSPYGRYSSSYVHSNIFYFLVAAGAAFVRLAKLPNPTTPVLTLLNFHSSSAVLTKVCVKTTSVLVTLTIPPASVTVTILGTFITVGNCDAASVGTPAPPPTPTPPTPGFAGAGAATAGPFGFATGAAGAGAGLATGATGSAAGAGLTGATGATGSAGAAGATAWACMIAKSVKRAKRIASREGRWAIVLDREFVWN